MKTVGAGEFKTHASALLREAEAGETIVVTRHGKTVARLEKVLTSKETFLKEAEALREEIREKYGSFTREELREMVLEGRREL